ncbi:MAG: CinA family protein [Sphingomonadaceae bacterium]|jgi:nicotinamide mononucleotide (NMN) deamidase PncC
MLEDLNVPATRIAEMLIARGQKIVVADGATGGLISAALLTVPGATKFHLGGGVIYSFRGRDLLYGLEKEAYRGMRSSTKDYALLQARAIRTSFDADWAIAESGSVGGSVHPGGVASGTSACAVVGPDGEFARVLETGTDERIANMRAFTEHALELLEDALAGRA